MHPLSLANNYSPAIIHFECMSYTPLGLNCGYQRDDTLF